MRTILLALLSGTALASTAHALDYCAISKIDNQMRTCAYSPEQRYVIRAPVGFPVNLHFGTAETIKRTDFAYTGVDAKDQPVQTWKAPDTVKAAANGAEPRYKTNLPIWAFQDGHSSVVITTQLADGSERAYHFDLTAVPANADDVNVTSDLAFTYPAEKPAPAEAKKENVELHRQAAIAWQAKQTRDKEAVAIERLKVDVFYGPQNKNYTAVGETKYKWLAPKSISDNGFLTQMQWPDNTQIPTIAAIDPVTGDPRTLTPTMQGQMVIIPLTAARYRLWLGHDAVLDIKNNGWHPDRLDPRTGTPSPEVVRTVSMAAGQ